MGGAADTRGESITDGTSAFDWCAERSFHGSEKEESWTLKSRAEQTLGSGERKLSEKKSMQFRVKRCDSRNIHR